MCIFTLKKYQKFVKFTKFGQGFWRTKAIFVIICTFVLYPKQLMIVYVVNIILFYLKKNMLQSNGDFECDICKQRMESDDKLASHMRYHFMWVVLLKMENLVIESLKWFIRILAFARGSSRFFLLSMYNHANRFSGLVEKA